MQGGFGTLYAGSDAVAQSFKAVLDPYLAPWAKTQISKVIDPAGKLAILTTANKDRIPVTLQFCDSTNTTKKLKLKIPCCKSDFDATDKQALGVAIANLGLKFIPYGETTEYNADTFIESGIGSAIDVFAGDTASTAETA